MTRARMSSPVAKSIGAIVLVAFAPLIALPILAVDLHEEVPPIDGMLLAGVALRLGFVAVLVALLVRRSPLGRQWAVIAPDSAS